MKGLIYCHLKQITNRGLRRIKTATRSEKHGRSVVLDVLRSDLKESRESFSLRGRGRSFRVDRRG